MRDGHHFLGMSVDAFSDGESTFLAEEAERSVNEPPEPNIKRDYLLKRITGNS